jgi:hypothetical protein
MKVGVSTLPKLQCFKHDGKHKGAFVLLWSYDLIFDTKDELGQHGAMISCEHARTL